MKKKTKVFLNKNYKIVRFWNRKFKEKCLEKNDYFI